MDDDGLPGAAPGPGESRVLLLRHGQTEANRLGQLLGATDVPLNAEGRAQARRLGRWLARHERIDAVYSSPMLRARETAELVCGELGLAGPRRFDPGLAEMNFGHAEGVPVAELATRFPHLADVVGTALPEHPDWQWPGGDYRVAWYRNAVDTVDRFAAEHEGRTVALVTHGGVITGYLHWASRQVLGFALDMEVANCSVTELRVRGGTVTVARMGETPWA